MTRKNILSTFKEFSIFKNTITYKMFQKFVPNVLQINYLSIESA